MLKLNLPITGGPAVPVEDTERKKRLQYIIQVLKRGIRIIY